MRFIRGFIAFLILLCCGHTASATHLYGGELYYTHLSGNRYMITMVLYGDCSGGAFSSLKESTPEIKIYTGTTLYATRTLPINAPKDGVEITPVCTESLGTTTCSGGTVPGVKRFTYSDTITLLPASNWRMFFTGILSYAPIEYSSGRSGSITNIADASSSVMALEATLNNSVAPNSSPTYTTIPTPFFCINVSQEYNPGAVDINTGDSLVYDLVDGFESTSGTVNYLAGYSASNPLASATGTFSFNKRSGQLAFLPNRTQNSLVVYKVSEYRAGVLIGTSMREMTFIVLSTCSNRSPYGKISNVSKGVASSNTVVNACKSDTMLTFNINPVDSDGNRIIMTVAGLPAGATLAITGSGTTAPLSAFAWNTKSIPAGTYYFFVTYQDNGCPLSSKQTVAYTINLVARPTAVINLIRPASCVGKAVLDITPLNGTSPWTIGISSGASLLKLITGSAIPHRDSLGPGTYTFNLVNSIGCTGQADYTIEAPLPVVITSLSVIQPLCNAGTDGNVTVAATSGRPPYQYRIDGGTYSSSPTLGGLKAGVHTVRIQDANLCTRDTTFILAEPEQVTISSLIVTYPACFGSATGLATINGSGGKTPYTYSLNGAPFTGTGTFSGIGAGTHRVTIRDAHNCIRDTSFYLPDADSLSLAVTTNKSFCNSFSTGAISVLASGGSAPYLYALGGTGTFSAENTYDDLRGGVYTIRVKDANNCIKDFAATVEDSIAVRALITLKGVSCFSGSDGAITLLPYIGKPPFVYSLGGKTFSSTSSYSSLSAEPHLILIKDANGCYLDTIVHLTAPPILSMEFTLSEPNCFDSSTGSIKIKGSGGMERYLYAFDGRAYTDTSLFSMLNAGTYKISVRDLNGCIKDTNILLSQPDPIHISTSLKMPLCKGGASGFITANAAGGTSPYLYFYNNGAAAPENEFSGLLAGSYQISATDRNGCRKDTNVILPQTPGITVETIITPPSCEDYEDGSVLLQAAGGASPYLYALNGNHYSDENPIRNLKAGSYTLLVKDSNNCTHSQKILLEGYPKILLDSTSMTPTSCFGTEDGALRLYARGGNQPLSYTLQESGESFPTSTYTNLKAGTYIITVTDATSCTKSFTVPVSEPEVLKGQVNVVHNDCTGTDRNGSITAVASGGTQPYQYRWTLNNSTDAVLSGLPNGFYTVHITDAHNCTDSVMTEIYFANCCRPGIPNAFTPNNDGKNDVIRILDRGDITLKEFSIYNRYGQQVFSTDNLNQGWDGTFQNRAEETGVYYFYIRIICGNSKDRELSFKGDITLIR